MITLRNVNAGFQWLLENYHNFKLVETRNGPAIKYPDPLLFKFTRPQERVLICEGRECNPYFHIYEALWVMAGRRSVRDLAVFVKRMMDYSDDGETLRGAYGCRLNDAKALALKALADDNSTRRVVLPIYGPGDLLMAARKPETRDIPCNTQVMLAVEDGALNLTLTSRSSDMLWGAFGANFVHFTVLMEWLAYRLEVPMGNFYYMINNPHLYTAQWKPESYTVGHIQSSNMLGHVYVPVDDILEDAHRLTDLVAKHPHPSLFSNLLASLYSYEPKSQFVAEVALPMLLSYFNYRAGHYQARTHAYAVVDTDWRRAALMWLDSPLRKKTNA